MSKPTKLETEKQQEEGVKELDQVLPNGIDRRRFLEGSVTGMLLSVAGCTGLGGGGGNQNTTQNLIGPKLDFRLPVNPSPNYVPPFAAKARGYWEEAGITPPNIQGGNGSADTAKRIANGVNKIGHSAATPQVAGLARQDYNILQFGTAKAMTQAGLFYRKKAISNPYDPSQLRGKTLTATDGLDKQMWQLFLSGIGASKDIEIQYVDTSAAASLLKKGELDGIWDSIDDFAALDAQLDSVDLGFAPLWNVEPLGGYYLIVHSKWYNENNRKEYITKLLEGYSKAGHWCLTNREAAMDLLTNQVPELKTLGKQELIRSMAAGLAATNHTKGVKENGFGYLNPQIQDRTLRIISKPR
ncbi:MAG: ABC transporter substrate-binding protein [Halobacteriaceae archaeon]